MELYCTYIIETPPLTFTGAICVQFWYHMYTLNPSHMGRLVVFTGSQGEGNPLLHEGGENKGDHWILEQITVSAITTPDRIIFLNEERDDPYGDMALDMIDIQGGACDACSLNNGGCDTHCVPDGEERLCECHVGYRLDADGVTCFDCQDVYRKQLDASQAFTSLCHTIETYLNVPLATCLINACADNVSVVVYDSNVCSLKLCTGGDLQLEKAPGSSGWDIYVLDTTWTGPRSEDASSFPLWQLLTGLFVGAAALGAIITVVTVRIRKRISSGNDQGRTPYENAETITRHETTVENTETNTRHETTVQNTETQPEGVYEDVLIRDAQKTRGPNDV